MISTEVVGREVVNVGDPSEVVKYRVVEKEDVERDPYNDERKRKANLGELKEVHILASCKSQVQ